MAIGAVIGTKKRKMTAIANKPETLLIRGTMPLGTTRH
tara:strand:+ start:21421 stop:21534 length:114 start_codon:yes stop_codon:yes gene_type:complete